MTTLEILPMTHAHREAVLDMMRVFYRSPAVSTDGSEEIFAADVDACLGDCPFLEGYVFVCGDELFGYAMLAKSFSTEFGKPCIWIEDIYLLESARGQGIAGRFFAFLAVHYPGCLFRLEAEADNLPALAAYAKAGFTALPYVELAKGM